jgi:hypothetical protein
MRLSTGPPPPRLKVRHGGRELDAVATVVRRRGVCPDWWPMARVVVPVVEEADWARLIDQLRNGDCTPFLGAGACYGTLPTGVQLSKEWADTYQYPFLDDEDLARVMQYAAVAAGDTTYLKQLVCRRLGDSAARPPDFTDPAEPHALLAQFLRLRVFLTTNYDDFLVQALKSVGRNPRVAVCPWYGSELYNKELFESGPGFDPQPEEPLVYHLHGSLHTPESLVLTEDDYLEFLVNVARGRAEQDRTIVPPAILNALTTRPLLFIGYSLRDWTFRVLFHGLLRAIPDIHRRRHVSVQLLPPVNGSVAEANDRAHRYLTRYMEGRKISIFWGTAAEFCTELRARMGEEDA